MSFGFAPKLADHWAERRRTLFEDPRLLIALVEGHRNRCISHVGRMVFAIGHQSKISSGQLAF